LDGSSARTSPPEGCPRRLFLGASSPTFAAIALVWFALPRIIASNATEVDRGAGETGSASTQVLASAQSLSSESSRLKVEVDKFLSNVRAA
jgi:hypothetical protein